MQSVRPLLLCLLVALPRLDAAQEAKIGGDGIPVVNAATAQNHTPAYVNNLFLGSYVVSERQRLLEREAASISFTEVPLADVVRLLAEASGINYVMPVVETPKVSMSVTMNPFRALERITNNYGLGVYEEDDLYFIRKLDKENLKAITYVLRNIHLGASGGGDYSTSFGGGGLNGMNNMNSGYNSGYGSGMGGYGGGGYSGSSFGNTPYGNAWQGGGGFGMGGGMGMGGGGYGGNTMYGNSPYNSGSGYGGPMYGGMGSSQFGLQSSSLGMEVLSTIRNILGIAEDNTLVTEGGQNNSTATAASRRHLSSAGLPNSAANQNQSDRRQEQPSNFVSFNAESNSLFVIGTERQHQWLSKYIESVDKSNPDIAIDAMFVESSESPSERLGIEWSNLGNGFPITLSGAVGSQDPGTGATAGSTTQRLSYGTLSKPAFPRYGVITSPAFSATLSAMMSDTRSQVVRYPHTVTANHQSVTIQTTSNIPISSLQQTQSGFAGPNGTGATTGVTTGVNNIGEQQVGTIITVLPTRINDTMVQLTIEIMITTAREGNGDPNTNRVATEGSLYRGTVKVPSGYTLAIGGLERIAHNSRISSIPGLSAIPIFGFLFKERAKDLNNTNITLFITPTILTDEQLLQGERSSVNPMPQTPTNVRARSLDGERK